MAKGRIFLRIGTKAGCGEIRHRARSVHPAQSRYRHSSSVHTICLDRRRRNAGSPKLRLQRKILIRCASYSPQPDCSSSRWASSARSCRFYRRPPSSFSRRPASQDRRRALKRGCCRIGSSGRCCAIGESAARSHGTQSSPRSADVPLATFYSGSERNRRPCPRSR